MGRLLAVESDRLQDRARSLKVGKGVIWQSLLFAVCLDTSSFETLLSPEKVLAVLAVVVA
jgi:hypothetical protein